ncbi:MAG TPA: glutamine-hydrolyzing GMP synthase [Gammaproteobacteria bacterium]|nr:glutamine-hydrolyzing GMP synthase [Gammaproteobacteria bacterium]
MTKAAEAHAPRTDAAARARILVLDFGGQYTQLIARRVREAGVYSEILPYDAPASAISAFDPAGIILSGGPESVGAEGSPQINDAVLASGVPVLGICYGMQALAAKLGGQVIGADHREFGYAEVKLTGSDPLLSGLIDSGAQLKVWMSHGDRVERLPYGFTAIASSSNSPLAAMADVGRKIYGLQFHPEVTHTEHGVEIIGRFVRDICGIAPTWTAQNIIAEHVEKIRAAVGKDRVLLGLSGGVDSSVVAALLHAAIGDQLICVFVDTGLLRLHEGDQVMRVFAQHLGVKVIRVDAEERFLAGLAGVADPEAKRRVIGGLFVEVFDEQAAKLTDVRWLAQGTIYPDVIESAGSATGKAHVIKSHHNVGGLPAHMKLRLLEPLRDLFKDEVRKIGVELGLPQEMVGRHPFPGPGLGVRILGAVNKEFADLLRRADDIFINELRAQGLYDKVSQAFAVFLPVKSVGVMGDGRRYDYVIALRAVETVDFMTARWARLPYDFLDHVSRRIINEVPGISRVTYDISSKPPATIEWE